jgi:hypothetical protein
MTLSNQKTNVDLFVQRRKNTITKERVEAILCYIIQCYWLALKDNIMFSKDKIKNTTSHKLENYLRNRLVDDYLIKNKKLLERKMPVLNEVNFSKETEQEYVDLQDGKKKPDKIDIYVNKLGLRKLWKEYDENIYFAIECKRIKNLDNDVVSRYGYISDIEKFSNRDYVETRLPYEGQIAFIENQNINHSVLYKRINRALKNHKTIITKKLLESVTLDEKFDGAYLSEHQRIANNMNFSIYHLFFDYSNIVID